MKQKNWLNKRGVALVFAPEDALAALWESASLRIFRIDIKATRRADFLADLTQLPIATDSMDALWCHHVLEHIEDDRAAIKELHRTMRPATGELVVSVPMNGAITREYGQANTKESGHWRMYGNDFMDRLEQVGFTVEAISPNLSPSDYKRYGLIQEQYYLCRKPSADAASDGCRLGQTRL
jgi:predicted SAM-dependent methyltransferase